MENMTSFLEKRLSASFILIVFLNLNNGHVFQSDPEILSKGPGKNSEIYRETKKNVNHEFDRSVYEIFGMKRRPTPGRSLRIPKLMQHLYKAHMGDMYEHQSDLSSEWEFGFELPGHHITSRANVARSFHHNEHEEHLPGMHNHQIRLHFNMTTLPEKEVIRAAELLLHREAIPESVFEDQDHLHRVNVYDIIKTSYSIPSKFRPKVMKEMSPDNLITRLVDTRVVDPRNTSWEKFDVSLATSRWTRDHPDANHGILVEVIIDEAKLEDERRTPHVRLRRNLHPDVSNHEWFDKRPTLLTYTSDAEDANLRPKTRSRRSSSTGSVSNSRRRDVNSSRKRRKRKKRHRPCARHSLYVDFSDVGWNDWIVAPHGYDAFYCQGQCLFPLAEHLNATNHAIVQTLANSVNPLIVPKPCCVPTKLSSISMLYVDEHDLVVLKSYPFMVADACGCR